MLDLMKRVAGEGLVLLVVLHIVYNLMSFLSGLSMDARIVVVSLLLIAVALVAVRLK